MRLSQCLALFAILTSNSTAFAIDRIDVTQEDIRKLGLDVSKDDANAQVWCSKINTSLDLRLVYAKRLHTLRQLSGQLSDLAEELDLVYVQDSMERALSPELRGSEYNEYMETLDLAIEGLRAESSRIGSEVYIYDRWLSEHYNDPLIAYQDDELTTAREQCVSYALDNSRTTLWTLAIMRKSITVVADARNKVAGFTQTPYLLTKF